MKNLMLLLLASSSCFAMDNEKQNNQEISSSLDLFQKQLLDELNTISSELNNENKKETTINWIIKTLTQLVQQKNYMALKRIIDNLDKLFNKDNNNDLLKLKSLITTLYKTTKESL